MNFIKLLLVTTGLYFAALAIPTLSLYSCQPEQLKEYATEADSIDWNIAFEDIEPPYEPCCDATKFSVQLCIDDNQNPTWYGLWDECFNLGCQTSWTPASGLICFRCIYPICENGFLWKSVKHLCEVPVPYSFSVDETYLYQGTFWEACISFEPDECLAETYPNCYNFLIYAAGCPY
jgi:hypothetical protein